MEINTWEKAQGKDLKTVERQVIDIEKEMAKVQADNYQLQQKERNLMKEKRKIEQ